MSDWQTDPRTVPKELIDAHKHADYTPRIEWVSIEEKLDSATAGQQLAMAKAVV